MAIQNILKMGHPVLRRCARELSQDEILSDKTAELISDMTETMRDANGIGLAAPQVGSSIQLAIIEIPEDSARYPDAPEFGFGIYINPKIKIIDPTPFGSWEGCLSVPGLRGFVERPQKIEVSYMDETANSHTIEVEGFVATVFQHEFDHLDGVLFVDKLRSSLEFSFTEEYVQYHMNMDE